MSNERFKEILRVMEEVHGTKNQQYAGENGYLSNLRMCEAMQIPAWKGVIVRMTDKMARLMNLSNSEGSELQKEITDAFIDMGVYSGMGLIAYEDFLSGGQSAKSPQKKDRPRTRRRRERSLTEPQESKNPMTEGVQSET
jgi:hypothetical protein